MNPFHLNAHQDRNVIIANSIALIFGTLGLFLLLLLLALFGFSVNSPLIFAISSFYFVIIILNSRGFANLGRILLCVVPVILTLVAALTAKLYAVSFTDITYYDARFFLIMLSIVPCLVFSAGENEKLFSCLLLTLGCIILFDPLHEILGVGYYQRGFLSSSYPYINYVTTISFFGITGGAITLKRIIDKADIINKAITIKLQQSNHQLHLLLMNEEAQSRKILAQSEKLKDHQQQLLAANELIERQKSELQLQVKITNNDLENTTQELIKHNNELRQFSYTISHNLRGPVASLLGLTQLIQMDKGPKLTEEIVSHIKTAAMDLDNVFKDLNKIVDIRNSLYQLKERVEFEQEWAAIKALLNITDQTVAQNFTVDFGKAPFLYSVKPIVHSILFNLISNGLKYRSPQRHLQISVRTYLQNGYTILEVQDNGLGIDLLKFGRDLFKMYKRFHYEQEGKGLGLFLIRSQAELLNGFVEVESEPNQGSVFRVHIKTPGRIADQLCLDTTDGHIHYNAQDEYIIIYAQDVSATQSIKLHIEAIEFCKLYSVATLVFDLRNARLGNLEPILITLKTIKDEAVSAGVRRFVLLFDTTNEMLTTNIRPWNETGISLHYASDLEHVTVLAD
jgi:signal transduction histidine kinase